MARRRWTGRSSTGETRWGVTALQAVEEMDAGPIWGSRTFRLDPAAPRKSAVYNGPVADAAIELIGEVVAKATDPTFTPEPLDYRRPDVIGRLRPAMRAADRQFSWSDSTETILRRIRAADGSPGARTMLCGLPVSVFDTHPGPASAGPPGTIAAPPRRCRPGPHRRRWGVGRSGPHRHRAGEAPRHDSPCDRHLSGVPEVMQPVDEPGDRGRHRDLRYQRQGPVGILTFDFYNGAMSTAQCRRLTAALRHATAQSTKVLVIRGGDCSATASTSTSSKPRRRRRSKRGATSTPSTTSAGEIITCTSQLVVTSVAGNAGAGGVMLALGADRVIAARRRRAQPALPDDGTVRLGVLDLPAPPPGRYLRGGRHSPAVPADRRPTGRADRPRRRSAARSARRVRRWP